MGFGQILLKVTEDRVLNPHVATDHQIQKAGQTTSKQVQLQWAPCTIIVKDTE